MFRGGELDAREGKAEGKHSRDSGMRPGLAKASKGREVMAA